MCNFICLRGDGYDETQITTVDIEWKRLEDQRRQQNLLLYPCIFPHYLHYQNNQLLFYG